MIKTKTVFILSILSAFIIFVVHYLSHNIFSNPALITSNITIVRAIITLSTFIVVFLAMKIGERIKI